MVQLVVFVNLFFVPALSLYMIYHKKGKLLELKLELLFQYCIIAACNIPLTKVFTFLARKVGGVFISIDSGYYTILAMGTAVMLGFLTDLVSSSSKRAALCKKIRSCLTRRTMTYRQKLLVALPLVLLIVIAYVIRGPLEIYAGNTKDFAFRLHDFLPWLLAIGVAALAAVSLLVALLPDGPFCFASVLLLWFGSASWVQDLFLNKKLAGSNGGPLDWDSLGSMPQINFLIWILLLVAVVLFYVRFKASWRSIAVVTAGVLCLIQTVAVGSVFLILPEKQAELRNDMGRVLSAEKQMQLASEDNLVILLFDTVATSDVESMLEEYPEAGEIVKDFVYYDNVCSDIHHTLPSVPHFLTGNDLVFDTSISKWLDDSWNTDRCDRFYQILQDAGYERCLYTSYANISNYGGIYNMEGKIDNIELEPMKYRFNTGGLLQKLLKISIYRFLPYLWKQPFEVLTAEFNGLVTSEEFPWWFDDDNLSFYQKLTTERLSIDPDLKKILSFTHLSGGHGPRQHDSELNYKENASDAEVTRGLFNILQEYFDQMKALGIYDDATIIVMSDHGNYRPEGLAPMFFLKRPGETHEYTEVNSAPVSYQDFQATILELIGQNDGSFGTSFFDWEPGQKRTRTLYLGAYNPDWPPKEGLLHANFNVYNGYIYDTDTEELRRHYENGPDTIESACTWP